MKRLEITCATVFAALLGFGFASIALAQSSRVNPGRESAQSASMTSRCRACNIVREGLFSERLIGQTIYEKGARGFYPATVMAISRNPRPAIRWRYEPDGRTGLQDATAYFSQERMRELIADSGQTNGGGYLSDSERQQQVAVAAACASYVALMDSTDGVAMLSAFLAKRGCCESMASRSFGVAQSPVCR